MTISNPFSVQNLVKTSNNEPCKPRSRSGGFAYVNVLPDWIEVKNTRFYPQITNELNKEIKNSEIINTETRKARISKANKIPEKIQIISIGYKRNPDVIVEVLLRAKGICERCKTKAPFIRKSNNTPYLEVHHIASLANGGEDTIENAIALCPNCHREMHFGA